MELNPTRMCELLVGLGEVTVLGVDRVTPDEVIVLIEPRVERPDCGRCGHGAWVKDRPEVPLVDLPCFDATTVLVVRKIRWCCPNQRCGVGSWTTRLPHIIAPGRHRLTDRAARWATAQVGRYGRSVAEVADALGCDWHTVNDAVLAYGEALVDDDPDGIGVVRALSLDETLFMREGAWRTQRWSTQLVDARSGQLLDLVPGRSAAAPAAWLAARDQRWRAQIRWGVLDLSGPYRATFDTMLPDATQVADPFHVVKHANSKLDECRRRVQNEVLGHRGRKHDPLYRARRLLVKAHERLDHRGKTKLRGLLAAGDPRGEVAYAWHAKEAVRFLYDIPRPDVASAFVAELARDLQDETFPPEVRSLGRTLERWHDQIVAWHHARASNGPAEAINNLVKRIKRVAFGFRRFRNYRVRSLLYAGRPNWELLATITPR